MSSLTILLLRLYQLSLSPLLTAIFGHSCRFHPTCSEYTIMAVSKYGVLKGLRLGLTQLAHCHPYSTNYQPKKL